jgi:hypothetical protein
MTAQHESVSRSQTWKDYVPKPMSEACSVFLADHWQVATYIAFVNLLAIERDENNRKRAIAILKADTPVPEKTGLVKELLEHHGAWDALATRHQLLLQMVLCRAVDSYLCYITDLLAAIFVTRPETLRSNEQVTLDEVLQHADMKDLVAYLAEEKVLKLSFKGMRELTKELSKRPGLVLFGDDASLENAVRIIELRNLIAHARGVVNRLFLSRVPGFPANAGDRLEFDQMQVFQDVDFLARSVCDIETRAASKYGFLQPVIGDEHERQFRELSSVLDIFERALEGMRREAGMA